MSHKGGGGVVLFSGRGGEKKQNQGVRQKIVKKRPRSFIRILVSQGISEWAKDEGMGKRRLPGKPLENKLGGQSQTLLGLFRKTKAGSGSMTIPVMAG